MTAGLGWAGLYADWGWGLSSWGYNWSSPILAFAATICYNHSSAHDACFQPVSISHSHRPAYSLHSSLFCPSHRMLFLWFIINCICQFGWWETTKYFSPAKYFTSPHNGVQFNNELLCIPAARGGAGAGHCSDCSTSHSHCRDQQNFDTVTPVLKSL